MERKLLDVLNSVRKRRSINKRTRESNLETRTIKKFLNTNATSQNRKVTSMNIKFHIPTETNDVKNGTVLAVRKEYLPTQEWIDAQVNYIKSLNNYDYLTAMAYTVRSQQWLGIWLRTKGGYHTNIWNKRKTRLVSFHNLNNLRGHTFPLYPQILKLAEKYSNANWSKNLNLSTFKQRISKIPDDIIDEALYMYTKDLSRIIRNAPPLPKTMYVFRGLSNDIFTGRPGVTHVIDEFASAAYVPQKMYAKRGYLRIKLLKGSRVLLLQCLNQWAENGEYEVLINRRSLYKITKRNLRRPVLNSPNAKTATLTPVTDVTVF